MYSLLYEIHHVAQGMYESNIRNKANSTNKTWALLQTTGGKPNRTSFLCWNRNGHHNTELIAYRHVIVQNVGHHYTQTNANDKIKH